MQSNTPSEPITRKLEILIGTLYDFFEYNRKGRYFVYGATLLAVLIYAIITGWMIHRPIQKATVELVIITVVFMITLPPTFIYFTNNQSVRPKHLAPLVIAFAFFVIMFLLSSSLYYSSKMKDSELKANRANEEIQESKDQFLHLKTFPFTLNKLPGNKVDLTVSFENPISIRDKWSIVLLENENQSNTAVTHVAIRVSYPNSPEQKIIFKALGETNTYHGKESLELTLIRVSPYYARFLITGNWDSNSKDEEPLQP